MSRTHRLLRAIAAAAAVTALAAGPVWAAEGEEAPATEAPADEAPAEGEEPAEGGHEGEGGDEKIQPPLGFEDPQELVGWGFLALTGLAIAAGLANGAKQLKGTRPQADGSWRPR